MKMKPQDVQQIVEVTFDLGGDFDKWQQMRAMRREGLIGFSALGPLTHIEGTVAISDRVIPEEFIPNHVPMSTIFWWQSDGVVTGPDGKTTALGQAHIIEIGPDGRITLKYFKDSRPVRRSDSLAIPQILFTV